MSEMNVDAIATRRWNELRSRYLGVRAKVSTGGLGDEEAVKALVAEEDAALRDLMLLPSPLGSVLVEKIRLFKEMLGDDSAIFADRREWLFLAAIEADAARLGKRC